MRISDWSSDVCSSDLGGAAGAASRGGAAARPCRALRAPARRLSPWRGKAADGRRGDRRGHGGRRAPAVGGGGRLVDRKSGVEGKRGVVRVDLGGRRMIQKKQTLAKQRQPIPHT